MTLPRPIAAPCTGTDALAFVISHNLHRRHLTESQRAIVAAKMANLGEGRPLTAPIEAVSQPKAAEMLNVGRGSVQRAKQVIKDAIPELRDMVDQGEVSVNAAAAVSKLTEPGWQATNW